MKRLARYLLICSVFFTVSSCEADLMDYEGDSGVYFAVQYPWISGAGDSLRWEFCPVSDVSFFLQEKQDSTIKIRVQILGDAVGYDRYFKVVVVDTGTTAVLNHDYDVIDENQKIAANTHYTDMRIKLYKQSDLSGTRRSIMLRLEETPDFKLPFDTWYPWPGLYDWSPSVGSDVEDISAIEHTIYISDVIKQPEGWFAGLLGTFTVKKFNMMCDMFDLTINDFTKANMNSNRAQAFGQRFDAYLKAQKDAGNEILEDDGTPMKMGNYLY